MKRIAVVLAVLALFLVASLLLTPKADSQGVLIVASTLIDGNYIFGINSYLNEPQIVIPEGGAVVGVSARQSRIFAASGYAGNGTWNEQTQTGTRPSLATAYITTASAATQETSGAKVHDVEVNVGHTGVVTEAKTVLSTTIGIGLNSHDAEVLNCRVVNVRGTGIRLSSDQVNEDANYANHDAMLIRQNDVLGTHYGIETTIPDTWITDNLVVGYRDYGIVIAAGDTACHTARNHCYGGETTGVGMYVNAGDHESTQDKLDDSRIGLYVTGNGFNSSFVNLFSQKNHYRNCLLEAKCTIIGGRQLVAASDGAHPNIVGVEIATDGIEIHGVQTDLNWFVFPGQASTSCDAAYKINSGVDFVKIQDVRLAARDVASSGDDTFTNQVGVWIDGDTFGTVIDVTAQLFNNTGDVAVKVDQNTIRGCNIIVREMLHAGGGSDQNLIDIPAGWDTSNTITLIQSDGEKQVYTNGEAL